MGLTALGELSRRLIAAGMSPDTPAAVVSGGNSPHPADVRGTLADIAERAAKVEAPAVIVVGAVAELSLAEASLPLSGVRVALTGTDAVQSKLRALFSAAGARVFSAARSRVAPLAARVSEGLDGAAGSCSRARTAWRNSSAAWPPRALICVGSARGALRSSAGPRARRCARTG